MKKNIYITELLNILFALKLKLLSQVKNVKKKIKNKRDEKVKDFDILETFWLLYTGLK
jgi:hypothetical protein